MYLLKNNPSQSIRIYFVDSACLMDELSLVFVVDSGALV